MVELWLGWGFYKIQYLPFLIPLPLPLHHCKLDCQTVKIILVEVPVVVQVIHVPHQELYAVVPGVGHLKTQEMTTSWSLAGLSSEREIDNKWLS